MLESLGLAGRSKDDGNAAFERRESCDKCSSWEFLTGFGGLVKGGLHVRVCL